MDISCRKNTFHIAENKMKFGLNKIDYPLASVIIVTYNSREFINLCLSGVFSQTYPKLEVIVVDNASRDNTAEYIREKFPQVTLIENKTNVGFPRANNQGIKASKGQFIGLLNPDAIPSSSWVQSCVDILRKGWGICASKVVFKQDPTIINSAGVVMLRDLLCINRGIGEKDISQYNDYEETFGFYGAAGFIRREVFEQVGLFDSSYFLGHEEPDLTIRAYLNGFKSIYNPNAIVYHDRSKSLVKGSIKKIYYAERNRIYTVIKYYPLDLFFSSLVYSLSRYLYLFLGSKFLKKELNKDIIEKTSKKEILLSLLKAWYEGLSFIRKRTMISKKNQRKIRELLAKFGVGMNYIWHLYKSPY